MSTVVETFESSGNSRAVGTVSGRDLTAMKKQLIDMEKSIAQCARDLAGRRDPIPAVKAEAEVDKIYPRLEPIMSRQLPTPPPACVCGNVAAPAPAVTPVMPAMTPAMTVSPIASTTPPDGVVEEIGSVIKMISSIMAQMMSVFKSIQPVAAIDGTPQGREALPPLSPKQLPAFSRSLPGTPPVAPEMASPMPTKTTSREDRKKKKAAAKLAAKSAKSPVLAPIAASGLEVHSTVLASGAPNKALPIVPTCCDAPASPRKIEEPIRKSLPIVPTEEAISVARASLDSMIKKNYDAQPSEFVVMSEDELYCIRRFRKMIVDRQGEMTKNFIHRFDRLCEKK